MFSRVSAFKNIVRMALAASVWSVTVFAAERAAAKDAVECEAMFERAQELALDGKLLEAGKAYVACVDQECPRRLRSECSNRFEALSARVPTIVVAARTPDGTDLVDVELSIDGVGIMSTSGQAIPLDPGPHHVRVARKGQVDEFDIVAREGEKLRTIVRPFAASADSPHEPGPSDVRPAIPWTVFGFGTLATLSFGSFAFFGIRGASDSHALHEGCAPGCSLAAENGVRNQLIVADISLAIGLAASALAAWSYLSARHPPVRPAADR